MPTYTYDHAGSSIVDLVRGLIPDRVDVAKTPPAKFSNEEISRIAGINTNDPFLTAACLCEVLATESTPGGISFSVSSGVSVSKGSIPSNYLARARQLRETARSIPCEIITSVAYKISHYGEDLSRYIGDSEDTVGNSDDEVL